MKMTVAGLIEEKVEMPAGVKLKIEGTTITVSSKNGQLSRDFAHPRVKVSEKNQEIVVSCEYPKVRDKAVVGTFVSHITNMIEGVTIGFEYQMKIVFSHFPMKASVKGETFLIENFLGEKSPRKAKILGATKIVVKGSDVVLNGPDVEAVGQTAANIERACKIRGFDPRVFQDGIYITAKAKEVSH
jgi:large subunit ribosomal protein L6